MAIYDKPTKTLMTEWANGNLKPEQLFGRAEVVRWFAANYPKLAKGTITAHIAGMAVNSRTRAHHPSIKEGAGYDLFWQESPTMFRLWDPASDPAPIYKQDIDTIIQSQELDVDETEEDEIISDTFAREQDLQQYLVCNLNAIEPGLRLYEDEGLTGIEFDAGGRRIDILAVDKDGAFVVIELKVSKGHDRVIGQLLRYTGWIEENMDTDKPVRGIIIANKISHDLILATKRIRDVKLVEYEISFSLKSVQQL
ncbi:endonuclease NucS domain-containing protein [uncultured Parasphingorhabdus sp.]|uniref:endonuclease NucS domain-containing protein n=1 Tax=uncultured Parasphingorhabdus sp. TaxID=2709694 RepID=UPI0030DD217A|tara:strand:+ start:60916 stop:61674 length:759 start_codon:yes stop_codon:yes gene_type:complete